MKVSPRRPGYRLFRAFSYSLIMDCHFVRLLRAVGTGGLPVEVLFLRTSEGRYFFHLNFTEGPVIVFVRRLFFFS